MMTNSTGVTDSTSFTPTVKNMPSSDPSNSTSENPLSESGTTSYPHISGVVSEFRTWLDDPSNLDWAIATFPVEKGYSDRNIFVSKLPPSFQDRDLHAMFANFGEVASAKVMLNVNTGASKETGFVQFATAKDALRARAFLRLRPVVTKPAMAEVVTQWAQNKHDGGVYGDRSRNARKLFLRNIPVSVTNDEMRALVTRFGDVAEVTLHADTYDGAATRRPDCSEEETSSGGAAAGEVVMPPSPTRTTRICFVTFTQPGVAARACAALHNTKPFDACGEVPLMAKIAEDNSARQARHQQGAMHRPDIHNTATTPATYGHCSPMPGSHRGYEQTSPMAATGWYQFLQQNNSISVNHGVGGDLMNHQNTSGMMAMPPQLQLQPQQLTYPRRNSPSSPQFPMSQEQSYSGNWCANRSTSCSSGGHSPHSSTGTPAATAAAAARLTRLTFPSQNPRTGAVSGLDPTALSTATGTSPRPLSTTASPTMKMPVPASVAEREARRPSRLTPGLSSTTSSSKARIPATTTSAPTSARRASRELGRSSLFSFTADAARTTSSTFSAATSGVYAPDGPAAAASSSAGTPQVLQQSVRQSRQNSVVVPPNAAATALSSQSSDSANSHDGACHSNRGNGHTGQGSAALCKSDQRQRGAGAAAQRSSLTSPYAGSMASPLPVMVTAALSVGHTPLSARHAAWEETIVSPCSCGFAAGSSSTLNITPTRAAAASQTRYRNNPYGMSIVLEKTRSTSFSEQ